MADRDDYIGEIPENPVLGAASHGLAALKRGLNYVDLADMLQVAHGGVPLPKVAGPTLGVGDLLMGSSPEEVESWAKGFSPFYDQHYGFNPSLRPSHYQGVVDTTMLPLGEAIAASKAAGRGIQKGVASLAGDVAKTGAEDESRRKFLKGTAATAGAATVAGKIIPKLLEKDAAKAAEKGSMHDYIDAVDQIQHESNRVATTHPAIKFDAMPSAARKIREEKMAQLTKDPRFTDAQRKAYEKYAQATEDLGKSYSSYSGNKAAAKRQEGAARELGWVKPGGVWGKVMKEGQYQNPFTGERFIKDGDKVRYQYAPHARDEAPITTKPLDRDELHYYTEGDAHNSIGDPIKESRWYGKEYPTTFEEQTAFHLDKFAKEHPRLHKALTDLSQGWGINYSHGGNVENTTHDRKLI